MNRQLFYFFIFSLLSTVSLQAQCPTLSYEASLDACSGVAPVFTPGATCSLTGSGTVVTDLFIYNGGLSAAPAGYETTAIATGTCATDLNPFQDGLLTPVSLGNGCEVITGSTINNITCDVMTVTYLIVASDDGIDDDMDGCIDYLSGCTVARFDVTVYPEFTVETTPGCLPSASLVAADGTVCATQSATAFDDCATPFTYDFTNYFNGSPATGTGSICQLPAPGIVDFVSNPPSISCPPTFAVECGGSIDPAETGMAVGTSNCDGNTVTVDFTDVSGQSTSGCGLTNYTIVRSWTATDACGNVSPTCTQNIVISDTQLPTLTCPADVAVACGASIDPADLGVATATDGCTPDAELEVTFTDNAATGDICAQTIIRTWVVTDNCGGLVSCDQTITLLDGEAPTISDASNMVVECDGAGNINAYNLWLNNNGGATASDDCGQPVTITAGDPEITTDCGGASIYTVTFTATDVCGNAATTNGTFTIEDTQNPVFTTSPISVQVECTGGNQTTGFNEWLANNGGAVAEDLCGSITWTTIPANPVLNSTCGGAGNAPVTFVATDDCGNSISVPAIYIVNDSSAPMFTSVPEDKTLDCDDPLNFNAPSTSDFCSNVTLEFEDVTTEGECANDFYVTRTWTAVDECGNASEPISQTIHFEDNTAPNIYFVDPMLVGIPNGGSITFACDDFNVFSANAVEATDNCSSTNAPNEGPGGNTNGINNTGVYTELDVQIFDAMVYDAEDEEECGPDNLYQQMVCTWTATDACGNEASITIYMNFVDEVAPEFTTTVEDITVSCGEAIDLTPPTAEDNCSEFVAINFTDDVAPGCDPGVVTTRTWIATDLCGNFSEMVQVITIIDEVAPVFTSVPDNSTVTCEGNVQFEDAIAEDACSEVTITSTDATSIEGCNNVTTRTWTAVDACGNTSTASATITETDTTAPAVTAAADMASSCADAENALASWLASNGGASATDECSTVIWSNDYNVANWIDTDCATGAVSTVTVTFTAADACGNAAITTATFSTTDTEAPTFTSVPANGTIACDADPVFGMPTATDDCSDVTISSSTSSTENGCEVVHTITWTATDACGNTATASQTLTAVDNAAPVFVSVPNGQTVTCDATPNWGNPVVNDDCGNATVTFTDSPNPGCNGGTITRTWTATDACGNTTSASATAVVEADNTAPTFSDIPSDIIAECNQPIPWDVPTVSDNCGGEVTLTHTEVNNGGSCQSGYDVTCTWTATDACGNTSTTTQVAWVYPEGSSSTMFFTYIPENLTRNCGEPIEFGTPIGTSSCVDFDLTYVDETLPGDCTGTYIMARNWTATNDCMGTATCTQQITVVDNTAPYFTYVPEGGQFTCDASIEFGMPLCEDACGHVSQTTFEDVTTATCGASYDVTRTWTITDACGNVATASSTYSVIDTDAPAFNNTLADKSIACGQEMIFDTPAATDLCGGTFDLTFVDQETTNNCDVDFTVTRVWTATDECGNTSNISQSITRAADNQAPTFTSTLQDYTTNCDNVPVFGTPTVEDNCGQVDMTYNDVNSAGDCTTGYSVTRTWTAIDACGNEVTTAQTVTVVPDTETMVAFSNVPADQFINCGDALAFGTPQIATNCADEAVITFEDVTVAGTCEASYAITRTWTAIACNITVTANATITIEDNQLPTFDMVPDNKVIACSETPAFDTPLYSDNCSDVELTFTDATNTNNCEVATTRTWTIADACGNVATAAQTITSVDSDAPVFTSTPQDYATDCNTTPAFGTPTVEDNCGQVNLTFNDVTSVGDCTTGYTVTRTWSAIDACGNEVTTAQTVTVVPDTETTIAFSNVPADQFINCGDAFEFGTPEIATNCADEAVITFEDATVSGTCASSYAVTRTWTAIACNITVTANATITVEDNQIPSFDTTPTDKFVACGETMEFDTPLFSDNCSEVSISHTDATNNNSCETGMVMTRTWTIADACGNVANIAQTITREPDAVAPTFTQIPQGGNVTCEGNFEFGEPVVADNCSEVNVTFEDQTQEGSCELGYTFTRTWTAADACGNVSTAQQTFVIENDNTAPTFTFVPANEQLSCVANPIFGAPTAMDACSNVAISFEDVIENTDCSAAQVYTRIWTAIDDCGNASQAQQVLTVMPDTDPPVFSFVPEDEVVTCDVIIEDNFGTPEAVDNCGTATTMTFEDVTVQLECGFTVIRTWMVSDACGNVATASKSLTVQDNAQPEIVFAPENKVISCGTEIPLEDASFADNCDVDFDVTFEETTEQVTCGYILHRTWTAVDNCANVTEVNQTIEVIDNEAPLFDLVPTDQAMSYDAFFNWTAPAVTAQDDCSSATVNAPVITDNNDCDNFKYFVTWTANDDCGNVTEHTMTIPITDATMEVSLDAPAALLEGNDEVLVANVEFGLAPYTYDWTILEGQGWTLNADGNLGDISAGDQDATFEVRVTDAHGCSNTTMIEVTSTPIITTTEFFEILPNPTYGDLNINYTAEFDAQSKVTVYDMLGRKLHGWKFDAVEGINNNNIDVTPLANATYVITVEVGERLYHTKFVKLAH